MGEDLDVLLERAAEGDRGAFAQFYDATSPQAYRLALAVAGDPAHAEQAVLRAYTTAWRLSPGRSETVSPHCWILGLVHGTARDHRPVDRSGDRSGDAGPRGPRRWLRSSSDDGAATRPPRRTGWRTRGLAEPG